MAPIYGKYNEELEFGPNKSLPDYEDLPAAYDEQSAVMRDAIASDRDSAPSKRYRNLSADLGRVTDDAAENYRIADGQRTLTDVNLGDGGNYYDVERLRTDLGIPPISDIGTGKKKAVPAGKAAGGISATLRPAEYVDAVAAMQANASKGRMPRFEIPEEEDDGVDDSPAALASKKPLVPSGESKPVAAPQGETKTAALEIPSSLLDRLRAAQQRDALGSGTSSLGRLLMATAAGYARSPEAQGLYNDYLKMGEEDRGRGAANLGAEQKLLNDESARRRTEASIKSDEQELKLKGEKAKREAEDAARMDDPNSPTALFYQSIAERIGVPADRIPKITERTGKALMDTFKIDENNAMKAWMEQERTLRAKDVQELRNQLGLAIEASKHGDRQAAIQARLIEAILKGKDDAGSERNEIKRKELEWNQEKEKAARLERLATKIPRGLEPSYKNVRFLMSRIYNPDGTERKDIPGVGSVAGGFPAFMMSDEGQDIRKAFDVIKNEYGHEKFGSALNKGEQERLDKALSSIQFAKTEADFRKAVREMDNLIGGALTKTYRGFDDDTIREHFARGGLPIVGDERHGPNSKLYKEGRSKQAADVSGSTASAKSTVTMTNGQEFREVDAADVEEAKKDGYRVVVAGGK